MEAADEIGWNLNRCYYAKVFAGLCATGSRLIPTRPTAADTLTAAAASMVVYPLATVPPARAGHGGTCIHSRGKPLVVSTVHMECAVETCFVAVGGTLANVAATAHFSLSRGSPADFWQFTFFVGWSCTSTC